jgi:DNA-binding SARP family transcriptional activator
MPVATVMPELFGLEECGGPVLCMVDGPYVMNAGERLNVPEGSKRLLAYVALHGGWVDRRKAAGTLWPTGGDERASGSLRSALWRLKGVGINVLSADKSALSLRAGTRVDVAAICDWANRLIDGRVTPSDLSVRPVSLEAVDLLPGYHDDWVIRERERLNQRLLHAVEALSRHLVVRRRWSDAVDAAMTAVNMEPLRESAQRVLVEAHLAEGNVVEARRAIDSYRVRLRAELDMAVSEELLSLTC